MISFCALFERPDRALNDACIRSPGHRHQEPAENGVRVSDRCGKRQRGPCKQFLCIATNRLDRSIASAVVIIGLRFAFSRQRRI